MQVFYAPGIKGNSWTLDEKESKHCIRVLRMKKNTPVRLIDGIGNLYEGIISNPDLSACRIDVTRVIMDFEKRGYHLNIGISPLKNPERFEWFVEKSVELGIDEITPTLCINSEKKSIKADRINNIIISAMKQSLKARLPVLNNPVTLDEFIKKAYPGQKIIAHCSARFERRSVIDTCKAGTDTTILIGPEGDFTDYEIEQAVKAGFQSVHLGKSRLRAETAGIAACHSIYFLNQ
jgi:16S rRNA (uracil1498-N3)-methyltransferase